MKWHVKWRPCVFSPSLFLASVPVHFSFCLFVCFTFFFFLLFDSFLAIWPKQRPRRDAYVRMEQLCGSAFVKVARERETHRIGQKKGVTGTSKRGLPSLSCQPRKKKKNTYTKYIYIHIYIKYLFIYFFFYEAPPHSPTIAVFNFFFFFLFFLFLFSCTSSFLFYNRRLLAMKCTLSKTGYAHIHIYT